MSKYTDQAKAVFDFIGTLSKKSRNFYYHPMRRIYRMSYTGCTESRSNTGRDC